MVISRVCGTYKRLSGVRPALYATNVHRPQELGQEKSIYIKRFNEKWVTPAIENPQRFLHVVQYEDIDAFIDHILTDLDNHFALRKENHAQIFSQENKRQFTARADPFIGPSVKLTEFCKKMLLFFLRQQQLYKGLVDGSRRMK